MTIVVVKSLWTKSSIQFGNDPFSNQDIRFGTHEVT